MRTIATITKDRAAYYENDESVIESDEADYYLNGEKSNPLTQSRWTGRGAASIGLKGVLTEAEFKPMMRGINPITGNRLRGVAQTGKERLAYDVTLSAPKSVSLALHIGRDTRVFSAHSRAVDATLKEVEDRYANARRRFNGERFVEDTGNLIVGVINHHTSRELDCQVHSHCVIMNATQRRDGSWVSLSHEDIATADWVGHYYRHQLKQELHAIGYDTYRTKDAFELTGISREAVKTFSKRTMAATKQVQSEGKQLNAKNLKKAAFKTRKAKQSEQSLEQLQTAWRNEYDGAFPQPSDRPIHRTKMNAQDAVESAINHHSERLVSFRREEIYRYIYELENAPELDNIDLAIAQNKRLIEYNRGAFTTHDSLTLQVKAIDLLNQGKNQFGVLGTAKHFGPSLNPGQKAAIEGVLNSPDQFLGWHGKAGVGKTYGLGELIKSIDIEVVGLAPTSKASQELAESLGIQTNTVAGHLIQQKRSKVPQLWIVDEAGLTDLKSGVELMQRAVESNARILIVGDTRQNQSIGAGSWQKALIDHGMNNWNLSQILRQKNDIQRQAVELISEGMGVEALSLLDKQGYVSEAESRGDRAQQVASEFIQLTPAERAKTLIIAGTNADRKAIATQIRNGLGLDDKHQVKRFIGYAYTQEQARQVENYCQGDYVRLERDYKTTGLQKGKAYQVVGRDQGTLIVQSPGGRNYRFDPKLYKEKTVLKAEAIAIDIGDQVRWTRNDRSLGLSNDDQGVVTHISDRFITIQSKRGVRSIPTHQPIDIDYGYVSTTYRGQGQTAQRVLVSATSDPTSSLEPFYVAASRQRQQLKVWTEDKDRLYELVAQSTIQDNPLELLEKYHHDRIRDIDRRNGRNEVGIPKLLESDGVNHSSESGIETQDRVIAGPSESIPRRIHRELERSHERQERERDSHRSSERLGTGGEDRNEGGWLSATESGRHDRDFAGIADRIFEIAIEDAIAESLEKFGLGQDDRSDRFRLLADAIHGYQELQSLETVASFSRLSEAIQAQQLESNLTSALEIQALTQAIRDRHTVQELDRASGIIALTELIQSYKVEQAIDFALIKASEKTNVPIVKPNLIPIYWEPEYPDDLDLGDRFWNEIRESAIDPRLVNGNMSREHGEHITNRLGQTVFEDSNVSESSKENLREKYQPVTADGIWFNGGYDMRVLATAKAGDEIPRTDWGVWKSFNPRLDAKKTEAKGKPVFRKYENPIGREREFFMPVVPDDMADRIYQKHGINPTAEERKSGLYFCALKYNLPIQVTEGAKKTYASVSQGNITIGIQGINLYQAKNPITEERLPERRLNPLFKAWATPGREITFAFDADSKVSSITAVRREMVRSIEQLQKRGVICKIAKWKPEQGKGLDDFIVKSGPRAYSKALTNAVEPDRDIRAHYRWEYNYRLKRLKAKYPKANQTMLDTMVFLEAAKKGERNDGNRVILQSDAVRNGTPLKTRKAELKTTIDQLKQRRRKPIQRKIKNQDIEY